MRLRRQSKTRQSKSEAADTGVPPVSPPYADARSGAAELTVGDYASGVPHIRIGEMLRVFARQLPWVAVAFGIGAVGAWYLTKDIKRSYTGEARVLVQLGSEYVYDPVAGGAQSGLLLTPDHIVLNETSIMTSEDVIRDVMGQAIDLYGWAELDPASAAKANSAPGEARAEFLRFFERNFAAAPRAKSSVIDMTFEHESPEIAVWTVNAFMDTYQAKRRELFVTGEVDMIAERRRAAESQLSQNEREIASFLRNNNVSDFDSERKGATERTEDLKAELNTLRANIREAEVSLQEVEDQLRATPETIDLYVDDRAAQRVAQAQLELKQLLARYLPTSDPVRQKEVEIAELQSLQAANGGRATGGRRVGPNPVRQELTTRRNTLQAQADALREKEVVIQQQLNGADAKTRRLRDLSPRFENLLRERDTLQTRLRGLNTKEQEALVAAQQAQSASENVREITRATTARKGRNMRAILFVLACLAWGGTLFLLALLKTFLDPRLYASRPARGVSGAAGGRRMSDHAIPEPVQPHIPATPVPAPPPFAPVEAPVEQPAAYTPVYADGTPAAHYDTSVEPYHANPLDSGATTVPAQEGFEGGVQEWVPPTPTAGLPGQPVAQADGGVVTMDAPAYSDNPYLSPDVAQILSTPTMGSDPYTG